MDLSVYWLKPDLPEADYLRYGSGMSLHTELCRGNPDHSLRQIRSSPLTVEFRGVALNNEVAAQVLSGFTSLNQPAIITIPAELGFVISPDGTINPVEHAIFVP
jgi:hypothetical protein